MDRRNLNLEKMRQLPTANTLLDKKYGKEGTATRKEFSAKARAWYYAELLREKRKEAGITQKDLAERIGKKREYLAKLEQGETDMQLSTFLCISEALGLRFELIV